MLHHILEILYLLYLHHPLETTFCISPCSITPTYKYDIVILLHPKSPKKYHKIFENRFTNKNLMPKMTLSRYFTCAREVIQNYLI